MTKLVSTMMVVVLLLVVAACGDDDADGSIESEPTATAVVAPESTPTTGTAATAEPTAAPEGPQDPTPDLSPTPAATNDFARPWHAEPVTHDDPASAASEFVDYFRISDPELPYELSEFMAGDSRSGEIELRPPFPEEFNPTILLLRLNDDDHWVVTGAVSAAMEVQAPAPDASVASPLDVVVTNTQVTESITAELWMLGADTPLARGRHMFGGSGVLGVGETNEITLAWDEESTGPAIVVVRSVWFQAENLASGVTAYRVEVD